MNVSPDAVWSEETGAARKPVTARKGTQPGAKVLPQARCLKTALRLSRQQKQTLKKWMGAYRFTYNRAVELLRDDRRWKDASCQYLNEQLVYASKNGRTSRLNAESTAEEREVAALHSANMGVKRLSLGVQVGELVSRYAWLSETPVAIRKEACRDAAKAEASNEAMRKVRPRHSWTLKYKNRNDESAWTIGVPSQELREAFVLPRPETRRQKRSGEAPRDQGRRNWTKVVVSPGTGIGPLWLVEELPAAAFREWEGGRGRSARTKRTLAKDCRITLDRRGRFHMVVPYAIEDMPPTAKPAHERTVGVVDPGDRVKGTVYSPHDGRVVSYASGKNNGGKDRIEAIAKKVDALVIDMKRHKAPRSGLSKAQQRARASQWAAEVAPLKAERDAAKTDPSLSPAERAAALRRLRKHIADLIAARWRDGRQQFDTPSVRAAKQLRATVHRQKARNLVTEARNKIALDMTRRWDTLVLPPFETSGMVKRRARQDGPRRIHSSVARSLLSWRHYQFRIHVRSAFLRAGGEVLEPDERYTTMTCGACGILNEKHSKEQWTCRRCSTFHLRDPAAARCIFIKTLGRSVDDYVAAARAAAAAAAPVAATSSTDAMDVDGQGPVAGFSPPIPEVHQGQ